MLSIILCATPIFAKNNPNGPYLYETSSANFSWGSYYGGNVIKSNGEVLCFSYNKVVNFKTDENGFIDIKDHSKIYENSIKINSVAIDDIDELFNLIQKAQNGPYERVNVGNDMGGSGIYAFVYDNSMEKIKSFNLGSSGSWVVTNKSPSASALIKRISKITEGRNLGLECRLAWKKKSNDNNL